MRISNLEMTKRAADRIPLPVACMESDSYLDLSARSPIGATSVTRH